MKTVIVSIALLLLCTSTSFASPPADPALFSSLSFGGSFPAPMQVAAGEDRGGVTTQGTCTANCGACSVSCTGQSCWALDGQYVQCDGVNTYCPSSCGCQQGDIQWYDGGCCSGGRQKTLVYECRSGIWVQIDTMCGGSCY